MANTPSITQAGDVAAINESVIPSTSHQASLSLSFFLYHPSISSSSSGLHFVFSVSFHSLLSLVPTTDHLAHTIPTRSPPAARFVIGPVRVSSYICCFFVFFRFFFTHCSLPFSLSYPPSIFCLGIISLAAFLTLNHVHFAFPIHSLTLSYLISAY